MCQQLRRGAVHEDWQRDYFDDLRGGCALSAPQTGALRSLSQRPDSDVRAKCGPRSSQGENA